MSGVMSLTGPEGGPPVRVGVSIGDLAAGMFGAIGIQAALLERVHSQLGKHVDVAMFDGQVALLENALARLQVEGRAPQPIGTRHPSITPFSVFRTRAGSIVIAAGNDAMFARLCDAIERPSLASDARFASNALRTQHHEALQIKLEAALQAHDAQEWVARLRRAGIACGPLNDVAALRDDPQVQARQMLVPLALPQGGTLSVAGCPIKFAGESPPTLQPAPRLDEHRAALLAEIGLGA